MSATDTMPAEVGPNQWYVTELKRSKDAWYRWHVRGWNTKATKPEMFSWQVKDLREFTLSPECAAIARSADA